MATLLTTRTLVARESRQAVRTKVDNGHLVRVWRGVYAAGPVEPDDRLRALFLRLPAGTLLSHHTAAARYGFGVLTDDRVHVCVPPGVPRPHLHGVAVHETVLDVPEPVMLAGVPAVPPHRCAVDLARASRRPDALAVFDAACRVGACTPAGLVSEVDGHARLRGVRQARELAPLADSRVECPQESHLRLVLVDAGLPAPEPQVWVRDASGRPRYRIDLGYRKLRVGIEYDGRSHTDRERLRADRTRMNWLAERGWTVRYFTDADLYGRPWTIVEAVRLLLRHATPR